MGLIRARFGSYAVLGFLLLCALCLTCTRRGAKLSVPVVTGPREGNAGDPLLFQATFDAPDDDSAAIRFAWSNGDTSSWLATIPGRHPVQTRHTFSSPGICEVTAQARVSTDRVTGWSLPDSFAVRLPSRHPLRKPEVSFEVIPFGDTLRLSWPAVPGASGYRIYLDDSLRNTTLPTFDVSRPHKMIEVAARDTFGEGLRWALNTIVTVTESLVVYGLSDTLHTECAIGFDSSGVAHAIDVVHEANWPLIDYLMEDRPPDPVSFWSPDEYFPPYNIKDNTGALSAASDFHALGLAPRSGYYRRRTISVGSVYSLWMDLTNDGWSLDDHFAKVKFESMNGTRLVFTLGYQTIGGLRWLISR